MLKLTLFDIESEECSIGDTYIFTFKRKWELKSLEWIRQRFVEYFVEKQDKFEVEHSYIEGNKFIVQAVVVKNPLPFLVTFGIIMIGSSTLLLIMGLQLEKVEKVITVSGKTGLTLAAIIIAAIGLIYTLK
ncbi:hypothetical protein ES702_04960 [subsurface metagenome]